MFIYKVKQNGFYKDYSKEYPSKRKAIKWYKTKGKYLAELSKRKLVLFKNSLRCKES